ncbi:hypothetical protein BC829DRAFT_415601 [Chytridium lagenaria]|nr:hypothetical protein BC829DRAFT_415601 [Chytridium lagenaria]
MSAAQGFVAKYVKDLALDDQRREAMLTNLKEGRPFVEEERMTVVTDLIMRVVKMTKLIRPSSTFRDTVPWLPFCRNSFYYFYKEQKLGKLSSEVMTSAVGDYMAKIAEVLYRYQGDIVKFLGDALLVTFSSNSPVEAADAISMRALTCCLEILKRYPVYEIDLNEWSQVLKVSQAAANVNPSAIETNSTNVLDTAAKPLLTKDTITKTKSLTLHIGVTRGMVERVVLGIPGRRMDYLVHGECLASLGAMLDSTKSGELGLDIDLLSLIKIDDVYSHISSDKFAVLRKNDVAQLSSNIQEERPNRRRSSIVDPPDTIKRKSSRSSISGVERSNSVTRPARCMSAFHTDNIPEVATELIKNFVNRSILFRLNEVLAPLKTEPGKKTETVRDVGREKRPTNTLRKHSVVARSEGAQAAGLIRTEYRTVSVMFLKVHGRFAADIAQTLFVKLLEQLDLFNGVFQQYSVDDKGQGMLACFGLPPFVSDKCGLIAVKAAARFAQTLSTEELCNISIAVTTGDILFGTVGWEYRRDAALLGDAVNVAARLLSIDRAIILLDDRTKEVVRETFSVTDLGFVKVKGKSRPINVWSISNFNVSTAQATNLSVSWTQNKKERQILDQYTKMWKEARKQKSFFLVEGDSGMGKSTLLGFVQKLFKEQSVLSCIARGSEVDQLNSFIAVRDVFVQILQIRVSFANSRNSSITISTIKTGRPSFIDTHSPTLDKVDFESILREANEDPTFASLLHALVKGETVIENTGDSGDHNASTPILDKRRSISTPVNDDARRRALKFVLVRIISYLCTKYKIAILLDDSQWVDESSLEVFYMIADSHQEILMAIFTRPIRNVDSTSFLHRFLSLGSLYHLPLTGMSLEDLKSILALTFYRNLSTDERQLASDRILLRYLLEKSDEIVYLDKDKQLCGRSAETLQVAVSRSVEAVIMSNSTDYQHVLRYASILGQYLDLHELTFLLENETFRPEDIRSLIAIHDQFEFLRPCTEGAIADSSAGVLLDVAYYFRHISIMNAIYQSVSFTEREELHLQIAEHLDYVVKTNPGRKEQTLPAICYHYWRARDAAKILQRVSELGFDCMKIIFRWKLARVCKTYTTT